MSSRNAEWYRRTNRDKSASGSVAAATGGADNIATVSATDTLFIQRIRAYIVTSAAQTITFQDDAGTPVEVAQIPASAPKGALYDFDFGAKGFSLTAGKNLDIAGTAGPAYNWTVECYSRQTAGTAITVAQAQTAI